MIKLGVLCSGRGTDLQSIIDATASGYGTVTVNGDITGDGTLTLNRTGVKGTGSTLDGGSDTPIAVSCPLVFESTLTSGFEGSAESYFGYGTYVVTGSVTGKGLLRFYSPATLDTPLAFTGDDYACVTFYKTVTLNKPVTLGDNGAIGFCNSQTYGDDFVLNGSGTVYAKGVTPATTLQTNLRGNKSNTWTGVCELKSCTIDNLNVDNFGGEKSTVRLNGVTGYLAYANSGTKEFSVGTPLSSFMSMDL